MKPENPADASPKNTRAVPLHDTIAARAQQIWEEQGRPSGRDVEFWLKAELEVLGADTRVRLDGAGGVAADQYAESTDANHAKKESGA